MSSYFSLPSFAKAKQNKEDLEKTNPQNPVLKDEDEKFLEKQISHSEAPQEAKDAPATKITEGGEEQEASKEETQEADASTDQVAVPEEKPETGDGAQESKQDSAPEASADDPPEQAPEESSAQPEPAKPKKSKKDQGFDLPSQEDAEAATRSFNVGADKGDKSQNDGEKGEKRTWASYLPTMTSTKKDQSTAEKPDEEQKSDEKQEGEQKEGEATQGPEKRTWAEYASSAYSSLPSMPSLPAWKSGDKDDKAEPVYNEDGTINEEKTKEKQEREVSVLLDNLNMSSINNRVFAFSGETQKIYERFSQVLKDTMNGGPTAYQDMEKLMQEAGPQLEKQFQSMPPFVQTLVKSLPSKLGTTLGPELMAAASEKPGNDMKKRMEAANKQSAGDPSIQTASSAAEKGGEETQKKKRRIPGLKGLVSEQGAIASILRNVVTFLQTRFPFLASATNVVMSLAVFILMFVFWYCHKRGKEVRLAKEAEGKEGEVIDEDEDGEIEVEVTDEEEAGEAGEDEKATGEQEGDEEATTDQKEDVLNKSEPSEVPLPDTAKGEKGAELEANKSVGT